MVDEVTKNNALDVSVSEIALDKRFGSLIFEAAEKKLVKVQDWLKESQALVTTETLVQSDIQYLKTTLKRLAEHLQWLVSFHLEDASNARQESDAFNQRVDDFYNDAHREIAMRILPFLREENRRKNPEEKKLDEEVQKAIQIRKDLESELETIKSETEKIRVNSKEVGEAKGERAAVRMAQYFEDEATRYGTRAFSWLVVVVIGYLLVVGVLVWTGYETYSTVNDLTSQNQIIQSNQDLLSKAVSATTSEVVMAALEQIEVKDSPDATYLWTALISKLVILAALWYGLSFIIKNYNVNSHLFSVNRHRAAVAKTLDDFIAYEQQQEKPNTTGVLQNATDAMFKHISIGYVSKIEKDNSNPVLQIVNDLMGIRNQS